MPKHFFILVNVFIYIAILGSSVKAEIIDCINYLVPLGVSRDRSQQACSQACQSGNNNFSTEMYNLCKMAQTGNGNPIYYSNGQIMTVEAGKEGANWFYPNGRIMAFEAGKEGATWFYSNGQIMTVEAGKEGANWFYPNGRIMAVGAGKEDATWYYSNGQFMTSNGKKMTKAEMLYPCEYLK